jgi:hypothetical protein
MIHYRCVVWFGVLTSQVGLVSLYPTGKLAAQGRVKDKPAATATAAATLPRLEIRLAASRGQLTAGGPVGITGTLTNASSDSMIYLTQQSVTLLQPPELEGPRGLLSWPAYFPSERQFDTGFVYLDPDSVILALRPGQSTTIGWSPTGSSTMIYQSESLLRRAVKAVIPDAIENELHFIFFTPGDYQISVQAKYWTDSRRPQFGYLTATQTMMVRVLAPQFVILLGAALGGLIAYIVFPNRRIKKMVAIEKDTPLSHLRQVGRGLVWAQKHVGAAALAMLWSAVVTILLSRLSETQLPIRVTVADFWGAIAIGLIAQYAGSKWFERLVPADDAVTEKVETVAPAPQKVS